MKDGRVSRDFLYSEDGLAMSDVGAWAIDKHKVIQYYASMLATSMKNKWDVRIYIDLFAGAGKSKLKDSNKIIPGSPLLALSIDHPFDRYVFCESDQVFCDSLKARVEKHFPDRNVRILGEDCNEQIEKVLDMLPRTGKARRGLALCFVDPYRVSNLKFKTLQAISSAIRVDFVVLIPTGMDMHRNPRNYTREDNLALDGFLGTDSWRSAWQEGNTQYEHFGLFVADQFGIQMKNLEFKYMDLTSTYEIRTSQDKGPRLYRLAFFSKSDLGMKFWNEVRTRTNSQLEWNF